MTAGPGVVPLRAHVRPVGHLSRMAMEDPAMANPGNPDPSTPDPAPGGDIPSEMPPRPFPGERPLGPDEPSAPYEDNSIDEPVEPGTGPETLQGAPTDPGIRV
jgi:hypothetical protein